MSKVSVIGLCGKSTFLSTPHFPKPGETMLADSLFEEMGGKGFNQAIAASRMGAEVSFLAAVGEDEEGKNCREVLEKNQVNATLVCKKKHTTVAFILTDAHGENQVTEYIGASLSVEDVKAFEREIITSDILLLQHEVEAEINAAALEIAKANHIPVILNPAPAREVDAHTLASVDWITPNEQEAMQISCDPSYKCIITLGKEGCIINGTYRIPALPVKVVNTTGAGDTFNGVLAVCIAEGMDIHTACQYAVTASGISVSHPYVIQAIPYREEIERRRQSFMYDRYLKELMEKYSVNKEVSVLGPNKVEIDHKEYPLLPWRAERRFMEFKHVVENGYLEGLSTIRVFHVSKQDDLYALLYREVDICEWICGDEICEVFAVKNGRSMNVIAKTVKQYLITMEIAVTLTEDQDAMDKHEVIAEKGVICDRSVDTQIPQKSIYVYSHSNGTSAYTDVDYELYGLSVFECAVVRQAFAVAKNGFDFTMQDAHIKAVVNAAKISLEKTENIRL